MCSPKLDFEPPSLEGIVSNIGNKLIQDMEPPVILNAHKSKSFSCILYINNLKI